MKQRAPALPNSPTFQQLWDALGSRLIETTQGHLLYTQGVRGSSPLPPHHSLYLLDIDSIERSAFSDFYDLQRQIRLL